MMPPSQVFQLITKQKGAPAFHKNSAPVSTILNLTFTESKIYTRENVRQDNNRYIIWSNYNDSVEKLNRIKQSLGVNTIEKIS